MKLWQKGLLVVLIGGLVNAVLIQSNTGGFLRELVRLVILIGFGLTAFGLIKKK